MTTSVLFRSGRIAVRRTTRWDLDFVVRTEHDPENAPFLITWSLDQHRRAIESPDVAHWIIQTTSDERKIGYMILAGLHTVERSLELKRLVIREKGQGYGQEALCIVEDVAFERLSFHRIWLDVMEHNERARRLYRSAGYVEEGTLRESLYKEGQFISLAIMSKLADEYAAEGNTACTDVGEEIFVRG